MPRAVDPTFRVRDDLGLAMEKFSLSMDREGFIGLRVLPVYETRSRSGKLAVLDLSTALKTHKTERASGANYESSDFTYDSIEYSTEEHGFEVPVDDREEAEVADWFDAEVEAAEFARDIVMRNLERRIAAKVFDPTTFTPHHVGAVWTDATNAVPFNDIDRGIRAVRAAGGQRPNTLIINWTNFMNLRMSEQILDKITSNGAGSSIKADDVTAAQVASVLGVPQILIAGAMKDTADEGQTATYADIWSDQYAMLAYVAPEGSSFKRRSLGRTIHWGEDGSQIGCRFETYRDESRRSDIVRQRHDVAEVIVAPESGYLFDLTDTTP